MASTTHHVWSLILLLLTFFLLQPHTSNSNPLKICHFDQIYQLGDSISDTGNLIRETPIGAATPFAKLPYGETFFKNATGRCSNGMLMIDYFALAAGLPFLNPYKNNDANFRHGANFAVAGSTALSVEDLAGKNISTVVTDCIEMLRNSLFMVGEIGGNDYNYALFQGKTIEEVQNIVHHSRQFPNRLYANYLTAFQTNNSAAFDEHHLMQLLSMAITTMPSSGCYADLHISVSPSAGFDAESTQKACCGTGGDYNFSLARMCGAPGVPVCPNPSQLISWDGVHLTEAAYKIMSGWLIHDILPKLQCSV